ncbi:MAG TPA: MFS transporter [Coleofasciculaceae cyanobacterium]
MNLLSTLEPPQRKNLLVLFAAGLLFWSSLSSLLPTLPLYVEDVGGTTQQIGIVMGSFAVGLLLFRSSLGKLADHHSRKLVVLIGMAVVAIAPLGYLFVKSIPLLILIRAFHGISIAAYTTGNSALIVDLSPIERRGELMGYMSLTNPLGVAIGPAIGGFLQEQAGYRPLFLLSFALGLVGCFFASQVKEPRITSQFVGTPLVGVQSSQSQADQVSVKPESEKFWQLLGSPRFRIPSLVLLLTGLVFGAVATFVALYIREAKVDLNPGWFYTAAAMSSFGTRLVTGRASDRYGRGLFITGSLVCYGVAMLLLSQAHSAVSFLLAGFLEGIGGGTLIPMMITLLSDRSYPDERARVFSLCIGGFDVGIAIAGPVLGAFAPQLGYQGIFALTTGFALLALIVFITQNSKDLPHSLGFATGRTRDIYALGVQPESGHN